MAISEADLARFDENFEFVRGTLADDVRFSLDQMNTESSTREFWYRTTVRTYFSFVEGLIFLLKCLCILMARRSGISLTRSQLALLHEERYRIDDNGQTCTHDFFVDVPRNMLFVLHILSEVTEAPMLEVDKNSTGWKALQKSVRLRNKITHPSANSDLHYSEASIRAINDAMGWTSDVLSHVFDCVDRFSRKHGVDERGGSTDI